MNKLRVAIIGCGSIAKHRHIPEFAANPNVELAAFCSRRLERAKQFAEPYAAKVYTDYKDVLQDDEIDAVSICTPNALHAPIAISAAEKGKHVLCEKPMATSEKEALEMIRAAEANGVTLMVAQDQRFRPSHMKVKEILQQGKLGRVLTFKTSLCHAGPENWSMEGKAGWFFDKNLAFAGALGDLGIHKADLIRWLLADEAERVAAFVGRLDKRETELEDNAVCILQMKGGAMGTLIVSWTNYGVTDNSTVLHCERGAVKAEADPEFPVIVEHKDGNVEKYRSEDLNAGENGVIDAFVHSVIHDHPPLVSGEEGLKSLKVVLAAFESAEKQEMISVR